MKRTFALIVAGIAGALIALLAVQFAPSALAQGPGAQTGANNTATVQRGRGPMEGQGRMAGGNAESLVGMAAAQLGISHAELVAQLGADGTILDALTAGGIAPQDFIDAFVASRAERLDAAVAAGRISRADADARLELVRSMAATRIAQPFSANGPNGRGPGAGTGPNFVDADGDGVCDHMPAGGQQRGGGRGPRP
jgi:hypothetical protein